MKNEKERSLGILKKTANREPIINVNKAANLALRAEDEKRCVAI